MSTVHQKFQADLDTKAYEAGLHRMENATKTSTARSAREFSKIDQSMSRQAQSIGSRSAASRMGQGFMQLQDVAVQLQNGTSGMRVLAQQGSQLASIFGPGGMVVGGLIAIGALIGEAADNAKRLAREAKQVKMDARWDESMKSLNRSLSNEKAIQISKILAEQGKEAARAAERQMELEEKINEIRKKRDAGLISPGNAALEAGSLIGRNEAENRAEFMQDKRDRGAARVVSIGEGLTGRAAQIRGDAPSKAEVRRQEREEVRSERRAIAEEMDKIDRKERNQLQGTGKPRTTGLTDEEREAGRKARQEAVKVSKDKKIEAEISQENIDKILNGIDNLIAK